VHGDFNVELASEHARADDGAIHEEDGRCQADEIRVKSRHVPDALKARTQRRLD
jgi:hypothetical protein